MIQEVLEIGFSHVKIQHQYGNQNQAQLCIKSRVEGGCDMQTIQMIIISKKLQPHSLIFPVSITSYYANLMTIEEKIDLIKIMLLDFIFA
jgi:hypothetical protein